MISHFQLFTMKPTPFSLLSMIYQCVSFRKLATSIDRKNQLVFLIKFSFFSGPALTQHKVVLSYSKLQLSSALIAAGKSQ